MDFTILLFLLFVFISYIISYIADKNNSKFLLFFLIMIVSFFSGFRGRSVGIDTEHYYNIFEKIIINDFVYMKDTYFLVYSRIFLNIFNSPRMLILIISIITNTLIILRFWDLRKNFSFSFMILMYLCCYFLRTENILRQFLAIAIVFYSTRFLEKDNANYLKFIVLVVFSATIHLSAILGLFILAFFVYNNSTNKLRFIYKICFPIIFSFITIAFYFLYFDKYKDYFEVTNISIGLMSIFKIIFISIILLFNKNYIKNKQFSINKQGELIGLDWIYFLLTLVGIFLVSIGYIYKYMDRIGLYFIIFEIVFFGQVIKTSFNRKLYIIIMLSIIFYTLITTLVNDSYGVFPYVFW